MECRHSRRRRAVVPRSQVCSAEQVISESKLSVALIIVLLLPTLSCSDNSSSSAEDSGRADVMREIGSELDVSPDDGSTTSDLSSDGGQSEGDVQLDLPADSGPSADASSDSDAASTEPGPDNLLIGCLSNADCPASGDDPGVCCTEALRYESFCSTESACEGGRRDACLTADQCVQRRPGEWSTCCHDRYDRNYCAPVLGTCQALVPCSEPSDCTGNSTDVCCSYHAFYQTSFCTNEFFSNNPATDCP